MTTDPNDTLPQFLGSGVSGATFSPCRTWRYCLWRRWRDHGIFDIDDTRLGDDNQDVCAFIGLNPSTADELEDDPTIRRCIGFAKSWGFGGIAMLNLFAFRATDPKDMKAARDPVGPWNDDALRRVTRVCRSTICCWGAHGSFRFRDSHVKALLFRKSTYCLGRTNDGQPKHPLYLKATTERLVF
jgi:hypothetical protein